MQSVEWNVRRCTFVSRWGFKNISFMILRRKLILQLITGTLYWCASVVNRMYKNNFGPVLPVPCKHKLGQWGHYIYCIASACPVKMGSSMMITIYNGNRLHPPNSVAPLPQPLCQEFTEESVSCQHWWVVNAVHNWCHISVESAKIHDSISVGWQNLKCRCWHCRFSPGWL